jgi:hypothetical protein
VISSTAKRPLKPTEGESSSVIDYTHSERKLFVRSPPPRRLFRVILYRFCLLVSLLPLLPAQAEVSHRRVPPGLVVAYFGQWSLENDPPFYLKSLVTNGSAALLNQLNYSQSAVKGGRCSIADPKADLNTAYDRQNSVSGTADRAARRFADISINSRS